MSKFNAKKYLQEEKTTSQWLLLPLILTLILIPFVMGLYEFQPNLGDNYWHTSNEATDIFLYYKSFYLMIMGGILLAVFIIFRLWSQKRFEFGPHMIPLYVYIGCIILSTAFSDHITYSIHGIRHHFEPAFVLLTYCIIVLYGAYFIDNERSLNWFINGFLISTALLCIFGLFQYSSGIFQSLYDSGKLSASSAMCDRLNHLFGCYNEAGEWTGMYWYEKLEPFKTDWMAEYVYYPAMLENPNMEVGTLSLNFDLGQVYMTLYNPNYIAFFTTLTAPFFGLLAFFKKRIWQKIVFALVALASIGCLIGSRSVAGFLALGVSAAILLVAFRKKIFGKWKAWLIGLAALLVLLIGFEFVSGHAVTNRFKYITGKLSDSMKKGYHDEEYHGLQGLKTSKDGLVITYNDTELNFAMEYDNETNNFDFHFTDKNGKEIETKAVTDSDGNTTVNLQDKRYEKITASFSNILKGIVYLPVCYLNIDGQTWTITNQIHKNTYMYNYNENNTKTPYLFMTVQKDDDIGTFYEYNYGTKETASQYLMTIAADEQKLHNCFSQIGDVTSAFDEIAKQIFDSENPSQMAASYFQQLLESPDDAYYFFYYLTAGSEIDTNYYYFNAIGKWTQIGKEPKASLFKNYPKLASNRGYIWSRTLPILVESPKQFLFGSGPDTFVFDFPHYDYVNLYRVGFYGQIITKPHSLYLQIATQTGVISLLALLALYGFYLVTTVNMYWKSSFTTWTSKVSVAILASVSGYMVAGLTNDSTVTYAYVFWAMMGVGIAVNQMERKIRKQEQEEREREERIAKQKQEREERRKNKKAAASENAGSDTTKA